MVDNFSEFKSRADLEKAVLENAEYFTACVFMGRARYRRRRARSLVAARRLARKMLDQTGRPVAMIYAVSGRRTAHVENVYDPKSGDTANAVLPDRK